MTFPENQPTDGVSPLEEIDFDTAHKALEALGESEGEELGTVF